MSIKVNQKSSKEHIGIVQTPANIGIYLVLVPTSTRIRLLDDALERPSSSGLSPPSQTEAAKEKKSRNNNFPDI